MYTKLWYLWEASIISCEELQVMPSPEIVIHTTVVFSITLVHYEDESGGKLQCLRQEYYCSDYMSVFLTFL